MQIYADKVHWSALETDTLQFVYFSPLLLHFVFSPNSQNL